MPLLEVPPGAGKAGLHASLGNLAWKTEEAAVLGRGGPPVQSGAAGTASLTLQPCVLALIEASLTGLTSFQSVSGVTPWPTLSCEMLIFSLASSLLTPLGHPLTHYRVLRSNPSNY